MIKRLKLIICFAAALIIGVQSLYAQESATSKSTSGRFGTEVDDFFSVNYWSDIGISKWISHLKVARIESDRTSDAFVNNWEAGLGIQLEKVYISAFYEGQFNKGDQGEGTWGSGQEPDINTDYIYGSGWTNASWIGTAGYNNHKNTFGLLLGIGAHGFQITVEDKVQVVDLPKIRTATGVSADYNGLGNAAIPAGATGYYQSRNGDVKPTLTWGAAQDMTFGKFSARPSASLYMTIHYDDEVAAFGDEKLVDYDYNSLTPGLTIDTSGVTIWEGGWGKLGVGIVEDLAIKIEGKGDDNLVDWENKLEPYVVYEIDFSKELRMGAKLDVPLWFGWSQTASGAGGKEGFFGVGAKGRGATDLDTEKGLPTFGVGIQYTFTNDGIFGGWVEKLKTDGKFSLNLGIKAYLPGYLFTSVYDQDNTTAGEVRSHQWLSGYDTDELLQSISAGFTFRITDKFHFDFGWDGTGDTSFLVRAKY